MRTRVIALCCALALLASACGSRLSDQELATGGGTGGGAATAIDDGATKGVTKDEASGKNMIGSLEVPCNPAPKGGNGKLPAGVEGVTDDSIDIVVISDKAGAVKVPTVSIEESMKAFVQFCNGYGGINGRKLKLTALDSKLSAQLAATQKACDLKPLAIVGSGSVLDADGAQAMVDCGLVEVPGYAATAAKAMSDRVVMPLPNPTGSYNIGPAKYIAKQFPDAIEKAGILASNLPTATIQADRIEEAFANAGFEFTFRKDTGIIQDTYSAEASEMKSKGVEWVSMVSATSETAKLLRDMKTQGFEPEVVDLGQQYYDKELTDEPGSEGALVLVNTVPFEEADDSPALTAYLDAYSKVGGDVPPSSLGVQSFSAGLLFAQAAKNAGDDLTRDNLLAELKKIHEWDGGGLHFPADPGGNKPPTCFAYMQVKDGKFVRRYPKKAATFACDKANVVKLKGSYGTGAKEKGN